MKADIHITISTAGVIRVHLLHTDKILLTAHVDESVAEPVAALVARQVGIAIAEYVREAMPIT